jgi:cytochrome P450
VEILLTECPQLDAVWFEVLRIYNNAAIARKATVDTVISNKNIHKHETVLGPFRQFHLDTGIFGQTAAEFDSSRFLADKSLSHVRGYYPFGGGNTYCPGRFFARSEIYIFVATALARFDMQIVPGQTIPKVDLKVPSSSAMPATKDCFVEIRQRAANS